MTGLACILFYAALLIPAATSRAAYITEVIDGDTVWALWRGKRVKIRFRFVDMPELDQRGGKDAREAVARLILGRWVTLINPGTDFRGRVLADIDTGHVILSKWALKAGHGFAYMAPKWAKAIEEQAKRMRKGVHKLNIRKPWEHRRGE